MIANFTDTKEIDTFMNTLGYTIFVGMLSSILTALVIYFSKSGWQQTLSRREREKDRRQKEEQAWMANKSGARIHITNHYLFVILRYLFLGNLIWLFPDIFDTILAHFGGHREIFAFAGLFFQGCALVLFYFGIGQILRYQKVRALSYEDF